MFAIQSRASRVVGFILGFWLVSCGLAASSHAQIGNASLGGTVTDQSGGVVPDANLTLTNQGTKIQAKATSNERGEYTFRNLTPGTYDLAVAKSGFQNYLQTGVILTINASAHADVALKVGAVTETVTVSGE